MANCAKCGLEYPADVLVFTVAGKVCASCEVEARAARGQARGDVWRILMGPFATGIGTLIGVMFGFAFGAMVIPVFYGFFGVLGLGCAWQSGSWGIWELLDREAGRPVWGVAAILSALMTIGWGGTMLVLALLVLAGVVHF